MQHRRRVKAFSPLLSKWLLDTAAALDDFLTGGLRIHVPLPGFF
jgi:hypothetical protein